MAKISIDVLKKASRKKNARFVLVTVMTPTAAEKMDIDANGRIYGLF
jgi:formyltetrahydrofolate synthetase